jgi:uncharacterized membrane protein YdjX (TVP38/TMEM64 family)
VNSNSTAQPIQKTRSFANGIAVLSFTRQQSQFSSQGLTLDRAAGNLIRWEMASGFLARHPRKITALAVVAVLGVAGVAWMMHRGIGFSDLFAKLEEIKKNPPQVNPIFYVLAVAVLPYVGLPSSFIYPLGTVYGFGMGLVWTTVGMALNLPIGYYIGSIWLRGPISRWLEKRGHRLPEVPPGEIGKSVVLARILPGPPLIAMNFLLAIAGVPFAPYFFYSMPLCVLFAAGILLASDGLLKGNAKLAISGVCAIIALALLAHVANAMYKARQRKNLPPTPEKPADKNP